MPFVSYLSQLVLRVYPKGFSSFLGLLNDMSPVLIHLQTMQVTYYHTYLLGSRQRYVQSATVPYKSYRSLGVLLSLRTLLVRPNCWKYHHFFLSSLKRVNRLNLAFACHFLLNHQPYLRAVWRKHSDVLIKLRKMVHEHLNTFTFHWIFVRLFLKYLIARLYMQHQEGSRKSFRFNCHLVAIFK